MIDRTSNQRQIPVSKAAAHITGNTRVRPVSKLRTIDETAELFSVSKRTVHAYEVLTVFSGKIKSANDTINTNDVEPSRASDRGARRCWCR